MMAMPVDNTKHPMTAPQRHQPTNDKPAAAAVEDTHLPGRWRFHGVRYNYLGR